MPSKRSYKPYKSIFFCKRVFSSITMNSYFKYTKVLENQVQSSIEIIKSHVISNRVIWHIKKPGWSILEVIYKLEGRYLPLQMFWAEQSLDKCYMWWSWMDWIYLDGMWHIMWLNMWYHVIILYFCYNFVTCNYYIWLLYMNSCYTLFFT